MSSYWLDCGNEKDCRWWDPKRGCTRPVEDLDREVPELDHGCAPGSGGGAWVMWGVMLLAIAVVAVAVAVGGN